MTETKLIRYKIPEFFSQFVNHDYKNLQLENLQYTIWRSMCQPIFKTRVHYLCIFRGGVNIHLHTMVTQLYSTEKKEIRGEEEIHNIRWLRVLYLFWRRSDRAYTSWNVSFRRTTNSPSRRRRKKKEIESHRRNPLRKKGKHIDLRHHRVIGRRQLHS
jgi:hypothetical protein